MSDHVDDTLQQWAHEYPQVDASPMGVIGRIWRLSRHLEQRVQSVLAQFDCTLAVLPNTRRRAASHFAATISRELGGRALPICELLGFPIDYVAQAVPNVPPEPGVARARPLGCPLSRRLPR